MVDWEEEEVDWEEEDTIYVVSSVIVILTLRVRSPSRTTARHHIVTRSTED